MRVTQQQSRASWENIWRLAGCRTLHQSGRHAWRRTDAGRWRCRDCHGTITEALLRLSRPHVRSLTPTKFRKRDRKEGGR